MNKLFLIGYLGKDAELKHTKSGRPIVGFTVATTATWKDGDGKRQERTEWHRCTAWGDKWQGVLPYLHKGQKVCIQGEVRYRDYQGEDGKKAHYTDIHVDGIELLGSKADSAARQAKPLGDGKRQAQQEKQQLDLDDDLPF